MFDLTPSERKGALVLVALVALGAVADLLRLEPVAAPPEAGTFAAAGAAEVAPAAGGAPRAGAGSAAPPATAAPLDLNTATEADLDRLPGIGPVLASRIVAHRRTHGPFRSPDDLLAVQGIGPRLLERLSPAVTVSRPAGRSGAAPAARGRVDPAVRTPPRE